jgi:hypothetical protein
MCEVWVVASCVADGSVPYLWQVQYIYHEQGAWWRSGCIGKRVETRIKIIVTGMRKSKERSGGIGKRV